MLRASTVPTPSFHCILKLIRGLALIVYTQNVHSSYACVHVRSLYVFRLQIQLHVVLLVTWSS